MFVLTRMRYNSRLKASDATMRIKTATELAGLQDSNVPAMLAPLLIDRDEGVRRHAIGLLAGLGATRSGDRVVASLRAAQGASKSPELRAQVDAVIRQIAYQFIDHLPWSWTSGRETIRCSDAARILGAIGDPRALRALVTAAGTSVDDYDRLAAASALMNIGRTAKKEAVDAIVAYFKDADDPAEAWGPQTRHRLLAKEGWEHVAVALITIAGETDGWARLMAVSVTRAQAGRRPFVEIEGMPSSGEPS